MGEKGLRVDLPVIVKGYAWVRLKASSSYWDVNGLDQGHAFNSKTGQNAHWDPDKGQWTDSKTGSPVTAPVYK